MTNANDILEVELSIEQSKKIVDLYQSFKRLIQNKDFQKVIEDNYFQKEASRLVLLKADPNMQTDERQQDILKEINAIGFFRQYLITINSMGQNALQAIKDAEQVKEELLMEDATNE